MPRTAQRHQKPATFLKSTINAAALAGTALTPVLLNAEQLSFYGTPGLIEMPAAQTLGDGTLAFTTAMAGATVRNTLTFQMTPRVFGTFRYSILDDFDGVGIDRYDRSFDLHVQLAHERDWRPALAVGLRDFGGTGIYSSEYLVATKSFGPNVSVTSGLGWGRLAERDPFQSPLALIAETFETRPDVGAGGIQQTGQLDTGAWFRGDVALFGGVEWQLNDHLTLLAEYSSDLYALETTQGIADVQSPFNFGLNYTFDNGIGLGAYSMYGQDVGVVLSYAFDPQNRPIPGGLDNAPPAMIPHDSAASHSWQQGDPNPLQQALIAQGLRIEQVEITAESATLTIENTLWHSQAQALGRAARVLANATPPNVDDFRITLSENGLPITTARLSRRDVLDLEFDLNGAAQLLTRTRFEDAIGAPLVDRTGQVEVSLQPYTSFSLFDPDQPLRGDVGLRLNARLRPASDLLISGEIRQPLWSNIDDATRQSNSTIRHVRSDTVRYAQESELELNNLTISKFFRPGPDLFGRVTLGYLEPMYGGLSSELLWFPLDSPLALGAELNYVMQRDFDILFDFQDYSTFTGHVSAYYDFDNGYHGRLDVGRYLAGDWGATLALDREFNNGFKVGGFFTLTDVSFDDFGEGSFDKGIRIEIPTSWLTGQPSRGSDTHVIRPVLRDGGARLDVNDRLYESVRAARVPALQDSWARFFR